MNDLAHRIIASYRSKLVKMAGRSGPVGFSAIELAIQQAVAEETTADSAGHATEDVKMIESRGDAYRVALESIVVEIHRDPIQPTEHVKRAYEYAYEALGLADTEPLAGPEDGPNRKADEEVPSGANFSGSSGPAVGQSPAPSDGELFDIAVSALNQSKVLRTSSFEQVGAIFKALADAGYVLTDDGPSPALSKVIAVLASTPYGELKDAFELLPAEERARWVRVLRGDFQSDDSNTSDVT